MDIVHKHSPREITLTYPNLANTRLTNDHVNVQYCFESNLPDCILSSYDELITV